MSNAPKTIATMTGATIDLATSEVSKGGKVHGVVKGKSIRNASGALAKCPSGTVAILWLPVGDKTMTVALGSAAADAWDAAQARKLDTARQDYLATPAGQRSTLVTDVEAAERKHAKSYDSEQTRHADDDAVSLLKARQALADFDAAYPQVVTAIRNQQANDDSIMAGAGTFNDNN